MSLNVKANQICAQQTVEQKAAAQGHIPKACGLGQGMCDTDGIVVTNNHVIADADEIEVIFNDGTKIRPKLVGNDKKTDLAVLRVKPDKPLTAVKFGDSEKLRVGDWVMAIGNPFGLGGTVTAGIVSARNRNINSGPYDNYIQTDASINRGNSGGPLFNMDGEVMGINTAIISPSGGSIGIGFAVPSKTVASVVEQLREVRRDAARLARRANPDGDRRDRRDPRHQAGARRAGGRRRRQGSGQAGRHRAGDVIVKFDGKDIKDERPAARRRRDGGRQGCRRRRHAQGQGRDLKVTLGRLEDGEKRTGRRRRPRTTRREAGRRRRSASSSPASQGSACAVQDQGQRRGRRRHRGRRGSARRKSGSPPATSSSRSAQERSPTPRTSGSASMSSGRGRSRCCCWCSNGDGELRFVALSREVATELCVLIRSRDEMTQLSLHKLLAPIALHIEQRGEVAMVDPRARRRPRPRAWRDRRRRGPPPRSCRDRWRRRRPPACRVARSKLSRSSISVASLASRPRIGSRTRRSACRSRPRAGWRGSRRSRHARRPRR